MELQDACVSAHREISGFHAEVFHISRKLDELAARSGSAEELVPEIRGLHAAVEGLDRKISDLGRQLPTSSSSLGEDIAWYEWI
jgi:capsule polysaccharide export protein KpsE/RkpR